MNCFIKDETEREKGKKSTKEARTSEETWNSIPRLCECRSSGAVEEEKIIKNPARRERVSERGQVRDSSIGDRKISRARETATRKSTHEIHYILAASTEFWVAGWLKKVLKGLGSCLDGQITMVAIILWIKFWPEEKFVGMYRIKICSKILIFQCKKYTFNILVQNTILLNVLSQNTKILVNL